MFDFVYGSFQSTISTLYLQGLNWGRNIGSANLGDINQSINAISVESMNNLAIQYSKWWKLQVNENPIHVIVETVLIGMIIFTLGRGGAKAKGKVRAVWQEGRTSASVEGSERS